MWGGGHHLQSLLVGGPPCQSKRQATLYPSPLWDPEKATQGSYLHLGLWMVASQWEPKPPCTTPMPWPSP